MSVEVLGILIVQAVTLIGLVLSFLQVRQANKAKQIEANAEAASDNAHTAQTMWGAYQEAFQALLSRDKQIIELSMSQELMKRDIELLKADNKHEKERADQLQKLLSAEIGKREALEAERHDLKQQISELRREVAANKLTAQQIIPAEKESPNV